jgi:hypothetical protein
MTEQVLRTNKETNKETFKYSGTQSAIKKQIVEDTVLGKDSTGDQGRLLVCIAVRHPVLRLDLASM